jgi:hypothetical protein
VPVPGLAMMATLQEKRQVESTTSGHLLAVRLKAWPVARLRVRRVPPLMDSALGSSIR